MKKIVKILLICLIIVGVICAVTLNFNVGLKYSENTQIGINIGKEFEVKDVKNIAKEIFNGPIMVQYIELYRDMVEITVKDATDEQISDLNNKINEKYEITNEIADIEVTRNAKIDFKSFIKPYIAPILITLAIIIVYAMIMFRKIGIFNVLYNLAINIVGSQALLFSIYAITRLPINRITPVIAIVVYIISILGSMVYFNKEKLAQVK